MSEICSKCGLPVELCICETISKESQKIKISEKQKRFRKFVTVVSGLDEKSINVNALLKKLKSKLACGGTYKDGILELQGRHVSAVKELLINEGFNENSIETS